MYASVNVNNKNGVFDVNCHFFMAMKDVCMWLWSMPHKDFEIYQKPKSCILCLPVSNALCSVGWLVRRVPQ
ncbi:unnamed protein product [Camellia sinensis]